VPAAEQHPLVQEVPIILPGRQVAVGTSVPLGGPAATARNTARVARLTVRAVATSRLDTAPFDDLAARVIGSRSYRDDDGSTTVDYEVHSGYCDDLYPRGASVVFRDAGAAIVGGDLINVTEAGCETGTKVVEVTTAEKSVPPKADLDRTEVTPYCDLARAPVSTASGAPAN
jgi:hypothetical protein